MGRLRAFLKTVWLVTADSKSLAHEAAKPQSPLDAAAFRHCVAMVVAACFITALAIVMVKEGLEDLVIRDSNVPDFIDMPWLMEDLFVPGRGTAPPALFAYAVILGGYFAGATRHVFERARRRPITEGGRGDRRLCRGAARAASPPRRACTDGGNGGIFQKAGQDGAGRAAGADVGDVALCPNGHRRDRLPGWQVAREDGARAIQRAFSEWRATGPWASGASSFCVVRGASVDLDDR